MTIEQFFEKLHFRKNKQWFYYGNDLLANLQQDKLIEEINMDQDVSTLQPAYMVHIGRVLSKENTGNIFLDSHYQTEAHERLDKELYYESVVSGLKEVLGKNFKVYNEGENIIVEIPEINSLEAYAKMIKKVRTKVFDLIGKPFYTALTVTNGIQQQEIK